MFLLPCSSYRDEMDENFIRMPHEEDCSVKPVAVFVTDIEILK